MGGLRCGPMAARHLSQVPCRGRLHFLGENHPGRKSQNLEPTGKGQSCSQDLGWKLRSGKCHGSRGHPQAKGIALPLVSSAQRSTVGGDGDGLAEQGNSQPGDTGGSLMLWPCRHRAHTAKHFPPGPNPPGSVNLTIQSGTATSVPNCCSAAFGDTDTQGKGTGKPLATLVTASAPIPKPQARPRP